MIARKSTLIENFYRWTTLKAITELQWHYQTCDFPQNPKKLSKNVCLLSLAGKKKKVNRSDLFSFLISFFELFYSLVSLGFRSHYRYLWYFLYSLTVLNTLYNDSIPCTSLVGGLMTKKSHLMVPEEDKIFKIL
jgi:hypothetical protein